MDQSQAVYHFLETRTLTSSSFVVFRREDYVQTEAMVQFVEKETDVLINLPRGKGQFFGPPHEIVKMKKLGSHAHRS